MSMPAVVPASTASGSAGNSVARATAASCVLSPISEKKKAIATVATAPNLDFLFCSPPGLSPRTVHNPKKMKDREAAALIQL